MTAGCSWPGLHWLVVARVVILEVVASELRKHEFICSRGVRGRQYKEWGWRIKNLSKEEEGQRGP